MKLILSLAIAAVFALLVSGLILPVAMGMVLSVILFPVFEYLVTTGIRGAKLRGGSAAGLLTAATAILVLLPVTGLTITATRMALSQMQAWRASHAQLAPPSDEVWTRAAAPSPTPSDAASVSTEIQDSFLALANRVRAALPELPWDSSQIAQTVEEAARGALGRMGEGLGQAAAQLPGLGIALVLMIVGLYFGLIEGPRLVETCSRLSPYGKAQTSKLVTVLRQACRSVVLASVASGAAQSFLALIFFLIVRVPNAVLLSLVVFLCSFVPLIGAFPVTLGATIYLAWHGSWGLTLIMGIGTIVISGVDNIVRPWMLQGRTNLHPLVAFLSALGGLQWMGFFGVFFGPIIASLFVALVELHSKSD